MRVCVLLRLASGILAGFGDNMEWKAGGGWCHTWIVGVSNYAGGGELMYGGRGGAGAAWGGGGGLRGVGNFNQKREIGDGGCDPKRRNGVSCNRRARAL